MAAPRRWAAELLHFWFHRMRPDQWFGRDDMCDAALRRRFGRALGAVQRQPASHFLRDRSTARAIAKGAIARGWHRRLGKRERQFLYMPLMHSEAIADQQLSLRMFAQLGDMSITRFARAHYRMVVRFGRFPHRNAVLGRKSTPTELRAVAAGNHW